ncbi:hypothetical protein P9112_000308 [Eukaryota sp. TZLM1-RC]
MPFLKLINEGSCTIEKSLLHLVDNSKTYTIGRLDTCDLVVTDHNATVSRRHFVISYQDSKWVLLDTSLNGTRVNGELMRNMRKPIPLTFGSTIAICCGDVGDGNGEGLPTFVIEDDASESLSLLVQAPSQQVPPTSDTPCVAGLKRPTSTKVSSPPRKISRLQENDDVSLPAQQSVNSNLDSTMCCICHDILVDAHTVDCQHSFCFNCLVMWLLTNDGKDEITCPHCRSLITSGPRRSISFNNTIEDFILPILDLEDQESLKERLDRSKQFFNFKLHVSKRKPKMKCRSCFKAVGQFYVQDNNNRCFCLGCVCENKVY